MCQDQAKFSTINDDIKMRNSKALIFFFWLLDAIAHFDCDSFMVVDHIANWIELTSITILIIKKNRKRRKNRMWKNRNSAEKKGKEGGKEKFNCHSQQQWQYWQHRKESMPN